MHVVKISEIDCPPALKKAVVLAALQASHARMFSLRLG